MSPPQKVPIYFLLGTTLSFAFIFGFGEIVNWVVQACTGEGAKPIFNSSKQIIMLVVIASTMGAIEGIVFGTLDAEVSINRYLKKPKSSTDLVI